MNIVITSQTYWPAKDGIQMVNQYIAESLVKRGHNVTVITKQDNTKTEEIHNGVEIKRFSVKKYARIYVGDKMAYQKYILNKSDDIDAIVISCAQTAFALWFFEIVDKIPAKKVLYMHGMKTLNNIIISKNVNLKSNLKEVMSTCFEQLYFWRFWEKIRKFDSVVHLFEQDSSFDYFTNHKYFHNYIINNCCENTFFYDKCENEKKVLKKYNIKNKYFICVANFFENKNQLMLIRAFANIKYDDISLVLVGNTKTSYYEKILTENSFLKLTNDRVHILSGIGRNETIDLIKNSYATVMVSHHEYFPITIIESMAASKAFICTNVGVVSKLPGGVIIHNINELTYWLNYYVEHPEFVANLGTMGKQYAMQNNRIEEEVCKLESLLF